MATARGPYWLLYDGDCRICAAAARFIATFDAGRSLRIRPLQDSGDLLGGAFSEEILDAMRVVSPDGTVTSGGNALPTLLEALGRSRELGRLVRASRTARSLLDRLYGVIVELRGHLVCRVGPAEAPLREGTAGP